MRLKLGGRSPLVLVKYSGPSRVKAHGCSNMLAVALLSAALISAANEWVALCLKLRNVEVPTVVIRGDPVWLNCSFDLEGDKLYSIKWHKNNVEFYRYLPEDKPPGQKYELPGMHVDLKRCREGYVYLDYTDVESEGLYRCEVSAEAPSFQTVKEEHQMRIYVFPKENPRIHGVKPHYSSGEEVRVVCESAPSRPAAFLKWLVNGKEAPATYLYRESQQESPEGLLTSRLQLQFKAKRSHFLQDNVMRLQCEAIISQAHSMNSEEILVTNNVTISNKEAKTLAVAQIGAPKEGPRITGGQLKYQVGDIVNVNCTASKSQPPAELHWYINDKEVRPDYLLKYPSEIARETPHLYTETYTGPTVLGLRFEVRPRHFQRQEMRLRCTATLSEVIRMSSEELEVDNRRQMSGLHVHDQPGAVSKSTVTKDWRNMYIFFTTLAFIVGIFFIKS